MQKIAIVIPYFGILPPYFGYFLASCRENPTIDWLIFSNEIPNMALPDNVHYSAITWEEMKQKVQSHFDFDISLNRPYKLCDFKPAYGEIFAEELKEYDCWAYGDMDLIYGNLRRFLTDERLQRFDRVYAFGHLSIHKNTDTVNSIYRKKVDGCYYYKDVFSSDESYTFDEWGRELGGYYQIFAQSGMKIYNQIECADIGCAPYRFKCSFGGNSEKVREENKRKQVYFEFNHGALIMRWRGGGTRSNICAFSKTKNEG